jgi:hypothetical protein
MTCGINVIQHSKPPKRLKYNRMALYFNILSVELYLFLRKIYVTKSLQTESLKPNLMEISVSTDALRTFVDKTYYNITSYS